MERHDLSDPQSFSGLPFQANRIFLIAGPFVQVNALEDFIDSAPSKILSVVEGAVSGAVPVVRDWPYFSATPHGAGALFPSSWIVATPAEAADRILAVTASEETWLEAGREASEHALGSWDWAVVGQRCDRLLMGPDRDVCSPSENAIGKAAE
ncbi:glycosyltransferase [Streptomyces sp. NPDC051569]|uniref:glycosyltransferase n=1 Tax=Streptomyces sp. NPDC051569 TaxID=3365661 RepID=UPI0037B257AE